MHRWWRLAGGVSGLVLSTALFAALSSIEEWSRARAQETRYAEALAVLHDQTGAEVATAWFTQEGPRVLVRAAAQGLPLGFHGFHVHSVGECDPATGFASAGGHLNPTGMTHPAHAGDMPVLLVNTDGAAMTTFSTDHYSVADLLGPNGTALIIHEDADNYGNIPSRYGVQLDDTTLATGDAGARLACGVIEAVR